MTDEEFLRFEEDEVKHPDDKEIPDHCWKILVVDDEPEVHKVTRLALDRFVFAGHPLVFFNANSAEEARIILKQEPDLAMILLDVVMETEHAGLELAKWIREDLKNRFIRIVLRTGQPGQAPEAEVIANYDINDYKEKTELTSRKLFTLMYSTLRSYRDIISIERNRSGLEKIIEASATLFELQSLQNFARGALEQLSALLHLHEGAVWGVDDGLALSTTGDEIIIQAGTGEFEGCVGKRLSDALDEDQASMLIHYLKNGQTVLTDEYYVGIFPTHTGGKNLLFLSGLEKIEAVNEHLLNVFGRNIGVAFENLSLLKRFEDKVPSAEDSGKVADRHKIAELVTFLAQKLDMDDKTIAKLAQAVCPKTASSDGASVNLAMLTPAQQEGLRTSVLIDQDRLERWDGQGFPQGKKGDQIHLHARLVALTERFDCLYQARLFGDPWEIDEIKNFFRQQRAKEFDPDLTDLLLVHAEDLAALYN